MSLLDKDFEERMSKHSPWVLENETLQLKSFLTVLLLEPSPGHLEE